MNEPDLAAVKEATTSPQRIMEPIAETLEAFTREGMHVGSARRMISGRWHVTFTGAIDEAQARRILEAFGAIRIESRSGPV